MLNLHVPVVRCALYLALALSPALRASIITRLSSEFTTPFTETWETFSLGELTNTGSQCIAILGGAATATSTSLVAFNEGPSFTTQFFLGPFAAKVHDGAQGLGVSSNPADVNFSFDTPVASFGGFWGIASMTQPVIVTFYDSHNNSLGQTQFFYSRPNNDGTLEWHGWSIDTPASKIHLEGAFFVNDSLRVISAPEPSCAFLSAFALVAVVLTQRYRSQSKRGRVQ
jgi:hypothetical protein